MMAKHNKPINWIDDAFDDEKMQAEIERAQRSRNTGCLISIVVFIIIAITLILLGVSMLTTI